MSTQVSPAQPPAAAAAPDAGTADLIARHGGPVPRYTSYPTAPHFHDGIDNATYARWLAELPGEASLSLYLHIPFCDRLCWFCGCHTRQTHRYEPIAAYLGSLRTEIEAVAGRLAGRGRVSAIHLGGGSPTMLQPDDMRSLALLLRERFVVPNGAEISVEIDPGDIDEARLDAMAAIGLTRASLGVQDFDPFVQAAINRPQTFEDTKAVIDGLRARGVGSVNIDMLYGLPLQTVETVLRTVDLVVSLAPERIALFGYAHVPWMKKHQTMIPTETLPDLDARFVQAEAAASALVAAGYVRVGIDHFARPDDALARAALAGRLHRNFQGYTTDAADALLGFGASAIGRLPQGYVQNTVATGQYRAQVADGGLAIAKGIAFTNEDRVRGYAIERLMCDFAVDYSDLNARFGAAAAAGTITDLAAIACRDTDGLTQADANGLAVTETGRPFVRKVAAGLDAYLRSGAGRHSSAV